MTHQTHYEVLVKQNGRWQIHGRFSHTQKDQAIEEAKTLDAQKHVDSVKVIQEIFDPEEGTSKEYNVYSPGQKKYHPPSRKKKNPSENPEATSGLKPGNRSDATEEDKKPPRSFVNILLSIVMISGFSTVVAGLFTWFTGMYLVESNIEANAQTNILFIVFLSLFVIAAIPMAIVFLGKEHKD